jgi:hypothetical protein
MWLSADPAMGEYIPQAPINDEARKRNQNLPGMGGVYNYVNLHTYHYAGNNPVKYVDPTGRDFWSELNFARKHPIEAKAIGRASDGGSNISSISTNLTINLRLPWALHGNVRYDEGSKRGAFRHTLWQAMITVAFGAKIAKEAGNAHEDFPALYKQSYKTLEEADSFADEMNNMVGRYIGENSSNSSPVSLAESVLGEFKKNGLYTVTKNDDGSFSVGATKITDAEYDATIKLLNNLNNQGMNNQ